VLACETVALFAFEVLVRVTDSVALLPVCTVPNDKLEGFADIAADPLETPDPRTERNAPELNEMLP
jgi:hypothetical protein